MEVGNKTCYLPNGDAVVTNTPCLTTSGDGHSHCCDPSADVCLDNGLCYSSWHGVLWRRTCTDNTWKSPYCSNYCQNTYTNVGVGVFARDQIHGNADQISCCIGWNTTSGKCLDNRASFQVRSGKILGNYGSLAASEATATVTMTPSGCPTTATTSNGATLDGALQSCQANSGNNIGAEIGIGLGVGLPLLFAVIALAILWRRERKLNQQAKYHGIGIGASTRYDQQYGTTSPAQSDWKSQPQPPPQPQSSVTSPSTYNAMQTPTELSTKQTSEAASTPRHELQS
jgi:hypothetical protein